DALAAGDADRLLDLHEPDASVRATWGGNEGVARGRDELRGVYGRAFVAGRGGGIELQPCATIGDGLRCAVEDTWLSSRAHAPPPQAGLAVFRRGPTGLVAACRIYDDVAPPPDWRPR